MKGQLSQCNSPFNVTCLDDLGKGWFFNMLYIFLTAMFIFENHVKAAGKRECKRTKFESNTSPKHGLYSRETETIYWN